ncbi:calpain-7 isoform X1 [Acipenser oxyrinchus oxyrinchus]|uniref:Calpain-7 isoform X1 n=1 Tax=Acipenser oxyrinchus oxyrinchus TaxID=40147 RepID=A0AAD8GFL4_ACIOX|nr:calpain-7 isoform X1 [Acipenser oxyrinchus oxyrinchus]
MDFSALELDAVKFAKSAVFNDQNGKYNEAVFYYKEAAQALIYARMAGSKLENIQDKISEYLDRVEALHTAVQAQSIDPLKSKHQLDLERAYFLVTQAFEDDENGNVEEAVELYTQAVELCIETANETSDQTLQLKLKQLARQALDRAEGLKDTLSKSAPKDRPASAKPSNPVRSFKPLGPDFSLQDKPQPVRPVQCEPQGQKYTYEEIEVLRKTSRINGIEYVPFMSIDLKERFAFPVPFSDKFGKLALSPKQKAIFSRWVRPDEISNNPTMIFTVSSFSIKQTVVSDCSFVASLAISAAYERRYNKKLITSIIYPQNKNGQPEYNPCGKYMVKLHINGVPRKVIIDDYLPVDHNGELLCSYSSNKNELWVSLIEKAYMKVMGGYDFPGSNSNIDLHALTGWIPERIAMHSDNQAFSKDDTFRMLYQRFHKGHVLITTATGVMTEEEGERWGLVPTHAYAVLDIREYKGFRFLQLKNPWSHLRWKGRFSERDEKSWTTELLKYLNFDPKTAQKFDNGVFWITWEDLCQYFDVIYLSWSPALFKESSCIHSTWEAKQGPVKDAYSLANNPQFKLEVQCPQGGAAVWVLLTRHITDKDDFASNQEFITLVVYKTDGKKVYYPSDPPPYIDGIRINSPHYLTKIKLTTAGTHTFSLVVSQYEKQNTIHYTLRVYSGCKCNFTKIPTPYTQYKRSNGQWKGQSAGGCGNYKETYKHNPIYQFQLEKPGPLLIELRGSRQYSVGFEVITVSTVGEPGPSGFQKKSSGNYRCGFCYMEVDFVPAGVYNIIPTTFLPNQEGPFFLDFNSTTPLRVSQLQ